MSKRHFLEARRGSLKETAMDIEEIAMEWLKENTDPTEYTFDDLRAIAKLIVRFVSEGVGG